MQNDLEPVPNALIYKPTKQGLQFVISYLLSHHLAQEVFVQHQSEYTTPVNLFKCKF